MFARSVNAIISNANLPFPKIRLINRIKIDRTRKNILIINNRLGASNGILKVYSHSLVNRIDLRNVFSDNQNN